MNINVTKLWREEVSLFIFLGLFEFVKYYFFLKSYWDERYTKEEFDPFDWLLSYDDVSAVLKELIQKEDDILMVGCGNAPFSYDM